MKKILLSGVDGNFGERAAKVLLERYPHEDLIFTAPTEKGLSGFREMGIETKIADYNSDKLSDTFAGADTMILISMPFVGPRRRSAQKRALDAAVKAGVKRLVYTSIVGAGDKDIDTYEVNDHIWFEEYVRKQPIHYLFMRNSQYVEAMISRYILAYQNLNNTVETNMGEGKMAFISRDDCAFAAAYAAMSDWEDRVVNVNGPELLSLAEFVAIGNAVTGHNVKYVPITDEQQYEFFDSIGVPRTTEEMWAQTAAGFPFCSDGMVTFGRAIRLGQMAVFTDDFEKLTGRKPLSVKAVFEDMEHHMIGERTSTD